MADTERDDMTAHDRGTPLSDGEQTATDPSTKATTTQPGGTAAPLVPSPDNPQQPAGMVPPGGPAKATSDILAEREADQRVDTTAPASGLEPTDAEREHAEGAADDEAKGTPG